MKSRQFCSVCKQWLDMEVVPTGDGDDDGVVWYRCPQCQGFLPKLSAQPAPVEDEAAAVATAPVAEAAREDLDSAVGAGAVTDDDDVLVGLPAGDPGDDGGAGDADDGEDDDLDGDDDDDVVGRPPLPAGVPPEPIHEYAAMLADVDPEQAVPYRPWESYEVGQCILHLAWNDCGVVVGKEPLPGGRCVIKCWFQGAGVVRLIENAPR